MNAAQRLRQVNLNRVVRRQVVRMALLLAGVLGLVSISHEFVLSGVRANPVLNLAIIGLFFWGAVIAFRRVLGIRQDALAFALIQEAFDDARRERTEIVDNPYWRHYRCMERGVIVRHPKSLGHMFEIAYDELLRTKNLTISVSTMQNVISGVEARLAEERSQLGYLSGLLVFLGLIGTFIGLMEMVGSVGAIIGGLNSIEGSSTDAMKSLLRNLQVPLTGMATGFSSSLFGLFGSLVVGLLGRFGNHALNAMKDEFSNWLATVSHLGGEGQGGDNGDLARLIADNLAGQPSGGGSVGGITDVGVVATMAQGFGRMNSGMDAVGQLLPRMFDLQVEQANMMKALLSVVDRLANDQSESREQLAALVAGQGIQAEYLQEMINQQRNTEAKATSGFNGMAHIMEVTGQAYLDGLRRLTAENYETNARLAKLLDVKAAGDRITEIAVAIESKVKNGFGGLASALERTAMSVDSSMQRVAQEQGELRALLEGRGGTGGGGGQVGLSPEFEDRLMSGFSELSRSFETVFAAYSTIVNRSLAQQAIERPEAGITPVAVPQGPGISLPEHEVRERPKTETEIDHENLRRQLYATAFGKRQGGDAA